MQRARRLDAATRPGPPTASRRPHSTPLQCPPGPPHAVLVACQHTKTTPLITVVSATRGSPPLRNWRRTARSRPRARGTAWPARQPSHAIPTPCTGHSPPAEPAEPDSEGACACACRPAPAAPAAPLARRAGPWHALQTHWNLKCIPPPGPPPPPPKAPWFMNIWKIWLGSISAAPTPPRHDNALKTAPAMITSGCLADRPILGLIQAQQAIASVRSTSRPIARDRLPLHSKRR
jgi:hypothetical protein